MSFVEERTSRNDLDLDLDRNSHALPDDYDDKEDLQDLRAKLEARKKPIMIGLGLLALAVVGATVAVSTGGSSSANTASGDNRQETVVESTTAPVATEAVITPTPTEAQEVLGKVGAGSQWSTSGSGSSHNEGAVINVTANATTTPTPTTTPVPTTDGPQLPYKAVDFDWTDSSLWERSSGASVPSGVFTDGGIKLTPSTSTEPIRTKQGWDGEKIVLIEWERSDSSDTNIWMLNTKLQNQFAANNGWPHWGELDIFEMFTQDAVTYPTYDFSGNGGRTVKQYGQMTMHMGSTSGTNCMCPSAASKSSWYQNSAPLTSACTAQFENTASNSIATVWGSDGNGKYIQLFQNPTITKGGKTSDGKQTYDISAGGTTTAKIYSNSNSFWGVSPSDSCASAGGFSPSTGFPFFESFRIILEEQKKNDGSAWFKVKNIQILKK